MKAILTKYLGPTNFRGARVKAIAEELSVTVPWDYALSAERNHTHAAARLAEKYEWVGRWYGGGTMEGYAFVCVHASGTKPWFGYSKKGV